MISISSTHYKIILSGWLFRRSVCSVAQPSVPKILLPEREIPLLPEVLADDIVSVPALG